MFDEEACDAVHAFAARDGLGHTLYHRDVGPSTPLEAALEAALAALGDDAPLVEYWWRDEWKHIEAHAACSWGPLGKRHSSSPPASRG